MVGSGIASRLGAMSPKQWIIVIILLILAIWLAKKSLSGLSKAWRKFWEGTITNDGSTIDDASDVRLAELEGIAQENYDAIYSWWDTAEGAITKAYALNDSELEYVVKHYERYLSENTYYYDVDWEVLPETDIDDQMLTRLNAMNLN